MLDRIAEWILAIPNSVPILLGAEPHNAALVRAVAALLLIVFVIYLIAARPFRSIVSRFSSRRRKEEKRD
jgi:hypothetical protein